MEEKDCKNIFRRWKELKNKKPQAQRITTEERFKDQAPLSKKEKEEFSKLGKELKEKCLPFLSPTERNELER